MLVSGLKVWVAALLLVTVSSVSLAETYTAENAKELKKYARKLKPGDELVLAEGDWHNQEISIKVKGTEDAPITIRASVPGKTRFTGKSSLVLDGKYGVLSGLLFTEGYLNEGDVITLEGEHHRITSSAIINYSAPDMDTRYHWLTLRGDHHRVDHNHFEGQNHSGVTLVVRLDEKKAGHHHISHNYFGPRITGNGNGFETIRIGTGSYSGVRANVIVEHNLFEGCDGEMEIISNKSIGNTYRFNTFLKSAGTLTIRQGSEVVVAHNHFIGEGKNATGGVRVIGTEHLIYSNRFESLGGRADGVLSITAGTVLEKGKKLTSYPQVQNVIVAGNQLSDNRGPAIALHWGLGKKGKVLEAENLLFIDNLFDASMSGSPLIDGNENDRIHWSNNIYSARSLGYPPQQGLNQAASLIDGKQEKTGIASCQMVVDRLSADEWKKPLFLEMCSRAGELDDELKPASEESAGTDWLSI